MRRIDKSISLATAYRLWHDRLEASQQSHGPYSASHKYHKDALFALLYCQRGLCAYTERLICMPDSCGPEQFTPKGRYVGPTDYAADLEHFDPKYKGKQAWLWENLFAVDPTINQRVKREKSVYAFMRPDRPDYCPYKYLEYDMTTHVFHARVDLDDETAEKVDEMVEVLGLNYGTVREQRRMRLSEWIERHRAGLEVIAYEFPTAWAMCLQQLEVERV